MAYSDCLAEIKTILSGVSNIGNVYDYSRWNEDWQSFLNLFFSATHSQIRGWEITRTKTTESAKSSRTNIASHIFVIRGYMSLDDSAETEKTFQNLVELVATAFRNKPTLNGKALDVSPLQRDTIEPRMFGSVLCHFAEMSIVVSEENQWVE